MPKIMPRRREDGGVSPREIGGSGRSHTQSDRTLIFHGASVSVLADIFRMKRQNVERRLADCPVSGTTQKGTPLYHIADAAKYLAKVELTEEQVAETLRRADPKDFPALTNKMFWEGLMQRRKYEEIAGELWHTTDVEAVAATAFNAIRMSLLLLPDELTDNAGLNEAQRKIVVGTVDTALETLKDALVEELRKPSRSGPESSPPEGEV